MKRWKRVLLEMLGPPAIGGAILWLFVILSSLPEQARRGEWVGWAREVANYAVLFLVGAYMLAGLPSVLFAAILEWRFARGLAPSSGRVMGWTASMGLASGLTIAAVVGGNSAGQGTGRMMLFLGGLGAAVGTLIGLLIRRSSLPSSGRNGRL